MANNKEIRILFRENSAGKLRRLTKIIRHNDGGFSIGSPNHAVTGGFLLKSPIDYRTRIGRVLYSDGVQYRTTHLAKLSIHPSGFAQFSSSNKGEIISGVDPITGEAKGLGVHSWPLATPITTGPTATVEIWGYTDFLTHTQSVAKCIVINLDDLENHGQDGKNSSLQLNFFVLAANKKDQISAENGEKFYYHPCIFEGSRRILKLRVIELLNSQSFIGIWAHKNSNNLRPDSGWQLCGPGSRPSGNVAMVLNAVYPSSVIGDAWRAPSLDYP